MFRRRWSLITYVKFVFFRLFGFKFENVEESFLKGIVLIAVLILGSVIAVDVFHYEKIPLNWKIAISAFLLLLPFCYFLQALLNVKSITEERLSSIQQQFRNFYYENRYRIEQVKEEIQKRHKIGAQRNDFILSDIIFRELFDAVSSLINDNKLYNYYEQCYNFLKLRENGPIGPHKLIYDETSKEYRNFVIEGRFAFISFGLQGILEDSINKKMQAEGIDFRAYFLPLSFFLFIYFAGILISLPLINSVFTGESNLTYIPLFNNYAIPFLVIQWGFFGGLVYTSISLLDRFLRRDLTPRVYFYASFRLLLSFVVAIVIYFIYMLANPQISGPNSLNMISPLILLLCFLAGVAPIQFLINFADSQMTKIYKGWKRRNVAGNRHISVLEGINSVTAQRLAEEGIDSIEQLALIDPDDISTKTKYPQKFVTDWKDQAVLYLLTADVTFHNPDPKSKETLFDIMHKRFSIRSATSLLEEWNEISSDNTKVESYLKGLGLLCPDNSNFDQLKYLFSNIIEQAKFLMTQGMITYSRPS